VNEHLNTDIAVRAEGLVKRFGDTKALDGVDLAVRRGTVLGLLGPNGAGKTTAVRVLATLLRPDGGWARVDGHDVVADAAKVRESIGLTGQYASVDDTLSGRQNLIMIGRLLDLSRREILIMVPLLVLIFWIGLYPKPFLDILSPSVQQLSNALQAAAVAAR